MRLVEIPGGVLDLDRVAAVRRLEGPLGGWVLEVMVDGRWAEIGLYETAGLAEMAHDYLAHAWRP